MTVHAYVSDHPDVLATWDKQVEAEELFAAVLKQVRDETGREIYTASSFGRTDIVGLATQWNEEPPVGWKWFRGKPARTIIEPRAKGPGAAEAQAIMTRLRLACPQTRQAFELYGIKAYLFLGLSVRSVGIERHGDRLWAWYGDDDLGTMAPPESEWFKEAPLSQFYAAREADTDDRT